MSAPFHTKVHVHSIKNEMFNRTMAFTRPSTHTDASVLGLAVVPDPAVPCGMKLAADGDPIVARIDVFEPRGGVVNGAQVGAITAQFRFSELIPVKAGDLVAQGDTVVGGGNGTVKKAAANDPAVNFVAEILTIKGVKYASVVKL